MFHPRLWNTSFHNPTTHEGEFYVGNRNILFDSGRQTIGTISPRVFILPIYRNQVEKTSGSLLNKIRLLLYPSIGSVLQSPIPNPAASKFFMSVGYSSADVLPSPTINEFGYIQSFSQYSPLTNRAMALSEDCPGLCINSNINISTTSSVDELISIFANSPSTVLEVFGLCGLIPTTAE